MFDFLKSWFSRSADDATPPQEFHFDGKTLTVPGTDGRDRKLRVEDVREIGVETTDAGPLAEDVFWVLNRGSNSFYVPQGSPVFDQLLTWMETLDGFDHEPFIESMSCTECRYFRCWRR